MSNLNIENLDVGFDVPAVPGMSESDIQTPCLVLMHWNATSKDGRLGKRHGMRHRVRQNAQIR